MSPQKRSTWKLEKIGGLKGNINEWMKDNLDGREIRRVRGD